MMGYFWGSVIGMSIPEDDVVGFSLKWLEIFTPLAIALGK